VAEDAHATATSDIAMNNERQRVLCIAARSTTMGEEKEGVKRARSPDFTPCQLSKQAFSVFCPGQAGDGE
jgi:hypothetical protein